MLAVRRQRTAELAIAQKDRELRQKDRDQAHTNLASAIAYGVISLREGTGVR